MGRSGHAWSADAGWRSRVVMLIVIGLVVGLSQDTSLAATRQRGSTTVDATQVEAAAASSIQATAITTVPVADPLAQDRSAHLFTMSDGNRVVVYYDGATINYRIETTGSGDRRPPT